ncbi:FadR/GntR family transcriptional regulator [Sphingomonas lenta]|nr:FadR/GntR family transcriptional regulator [Sphingomonas lenta]
MQIRMPARRSLASELVEQLRGQIEAGVLAPGDKIPTERELVEDSGVSRTVVREAIARLAAEGMVEPRQGSGVFVTEPPPPAFQVTHGELGDLIEVCRLLELRLAVETEMAGLAAERRSETDVAEMQGLVSRIAADIADRGDGTEADEALHLTIARASGNQYFVRFLEFLGTRLVPRRGLVTDESPEERRDYLTAVHDEHRALVDAIARKDADAARQAARRHLEHGRGKLERFIERQRGADKPARRPRG